MFFIIIFFRAQRRQEREEEREGTAFCSLGRCTWQEGGCHEFSCIARLAVVPGLSNVMVDLATGGRKHIETDHILQRHSFHSTRQKGVGYFLEKFSSPEAVCALSLSTVSLPNVWVQKEGPVFVLAASFEDIIGLVPRRRGPDVPSTFLFLVMNTGQWSIRSAYPVTFTALINLLGLS